MIWRAFPLHPDTPEEGRTLEELFRLKGIPMNVEKAMAGMKKTAKEHGLEFGDRRMTYNSRMAQEVGLWAQEAGKGHEFHMAAFKSYFVAGDNLAKKEVLLDMVRRSGLDPEQGEQVIEERTFSDAVDRDWDLSRQQGIMAAPTFLMGLDRLVGAQPYATLEKMAVRYGASPRADK